ncbi:MAG: glycosyltransferase family 2 protein [Planctomycetes bacterium]|nr:glycosyltransferase family 2 protein [Planctomycetota bacterium]MBU1518389.1 glycosyltransferase family 2 protein [Planctomycetota bacterium]MBU2457371.1 glycosyltransferase family 2 protein [Planctomycetota bacterium]MBU2596076.1 glycosyltransferase family 2 protein [Planctomycetota bacterium]
MTETAVKYSVVVPLYNEESVVQELCERLTKVMRQTNKSYEIVLVDDGSDDATLEKLKNIAEDDEHVVVVHLRRNFGQTPALAAGFDHTKGEVIISMDGDLQHLPEEIPNFLKKIDEGYDVVSGWREKRVDNLIMRKIPSRMANWLASKVSGVDIHDFGTTFKAYKRQIIQDLRLYGEMHRFIPAVVSFGGAKIIEIPIKNIERPAGKSNYGISRTFRVAFDLITLRFLLGYITRPLHFFGKAAFYCIVVASFIFAYVLFDKFYFNVPILTAHGPITAAGIILLLIGLGFISTGLIGEMISRVYFEATDRKIYAVRNVYRKLGG